MAFHLFRVALPPWRSLNDPLVQYDIQKQQRTRSLSWSVLLLVYLTLGSLLLFLVAAYLEDDPYYPLLPSQLLGGTIGVLTGGLVLQSILGHWRLLFAVAAKAANCIAGRRRRGDWDLIAITPVRRERWLLAQTTIISWQVFPLVRMLVLAHVALMLIGFGFVMEYQYSEWKAEQADIQECIAADDCNISYYGTTRNRYLPPLPYALLILPFGVLLVVEPILASAAFTAISLSASSYSARTSMAVLYSLLGIFWMRVITAWVLIVVGFAASIAAFLSAEWLGIVSPGNNIDLSGFSWGFLPLLCLWAFILSLFVEWIPVAVPPLLATDGEHSVLLLLWGVSIVTFSITFVILPAWLMKRLNAMTVKRLNRRER